MLYNQMGTLKAVFANSKTFLLIDINIQDLLRIKFILNPPKKFELQK